MNNGISVFLSHSHKDVNKVRKIRDILESLDCEPLMFFLKCLDDDTERLEDFIKKEIEARHIFIYCKSSNSEKSKWVQKELEYIRSLDEKRLYTIDIDNILYGLSDLLNNLVKILYQNKVFIYSLQESDVVKQIDNFLVSKGYDVEVHIENTDDVSFIPKASSNEHEIAEFQKYKEYILPVLKQKINEINEKVNCIEKNGIFIPVVHKESQWSRKFIFDNVLANATANAKQHNLQVCVLCIDNADYNNPDVIIRENELEQSLFDLYQALISHKN